MSDKIGGYKDLVVWQKSITLVKLVYQLTATFPNDERFGLISQMRRAAVSIPSNIAEGQARRTTPDFIRFLSMAEGSLAELNTQIVIAMELKYCTPVQTVESIGLGEEIRKMLNSLRRTLLAKSVGND
jgi:four helix bundle protein